MLNRPVVRLLFDRDVAVLRLRLGRAADAVPRSRSAYPYDGRQEQRRSPQSSSSSTANGLVFPPLLRARDANGQARWLVPLDLTLT